MKYDCEAVLTEGVNPFCFPEDLGPRGDQKVLTVMRVDICRNEAFDRAGKLAVEAVDENSFKDGSFK
jgi:hypothetical protein